MIEPHHRHLVASRPPRGGFASARAGVTATDVIVLLVLFGLAVLVVLMMLPRGREHARMASCQNNLSHIGRALALYDHLEHKLPSVSELAGPASPRTSEPKSPLRILLETLVQPNLLGVNDDKTPPPPRPGEVPDERPVPGFVCSSDPNATSGQFPAPISYRACTGDAPSGGNGAFHPGREISLKEIQDRDGLSFTAAFSERMVGDNLSSHAAACNYTVPTGPLPADACPAPPDLSGWRGDAGSSWVVSDYRSTLYNHAIPPNGRSSCIEGDGGRAFMGASSGHVQGVNLLFLDGRVMVMRPSIDSKIWREFARIGERETDSRGQ
jgi:Protein of unknown function (DUF1559)